ncbi:MAG: hypothetical protein IJE60_08995 [Tyzzerella sp.]|nr:hypothetical protein [Tyzzerella sp.]
MKKWKSLVSMLLIFALVAGNCFQTARASGSETPEVAVDIPGSWRSVEYKFFNFNYSDDGTIRAGNTVSDNLDKMFYEFAYEVDLYYVEEIRFYLNNTTGLPLSFNVVSTKAAVTTTNNQDIIDDSEAAIQFWNQHPGCLWMLKHDATVSPLQVKGVNDSAWQNADVTRYGGQGEAPVLTVPAGFEGYVSIPLTDSEKTTDGTTHRISKGLALQLSVGNKNGTSPNISDYAGKSFVLREIQAVCADEDAKKNVMDIPAEFLVPATGTWSSVEYKFFNFTYEEDGTITAGSNITDNLDKMLYTLDYEADLYYAESIRFYVKNTTGLPLSFASVAPKAVVTTTDNEGLIEGSENEIQFWNQHPGCLWTLVHDATAAPVQVKVANGSMWKNADTTSYGGQGTPVLTLPAGFEGYVSIPLTDSEKTKDGTLHRTSKGIALELSVGYKNDEEGSPKCKDYANKEFQIKDVSFVCSTEENANKVIEIKEEIKFPVTLNGKWKSVEYKFFNFKYGKDGTITAGTKIDDSFDKMFYQFEKRVDLYYADSIQFYVKNTTGLPLAFNSVAVKAAVTTNDNADIIDGDTSFWDEHPGCLWMLEHNSATAPIKVKTIDGKAWTNADTTAYGGTGNSVLTLPAGFEGYVSIPITASERTTDGTTHRVSDGMALQLGVGYKDGSNTPDISAYANKSFVIRDVQVLCNTQDAADQVATERQEEIKETVSIPVSGTMESVDYKFFGLTYKDGKITTGKNITEPFERIYYRLDSVVDLGYVDEIQFYIENTTGLPLSFSDVSAKAIITTNDNEFRFDSDYQETALFYNKHVGSLWLMPHNAGVTPLQIKSINSDEWEDADTTAYGGNGISMLTIPAGFKGYVSMPLTNADKFIDTSINRITNAFGLQLSVGYKDGEPGTPKCSDYANKTFCIKDVRIVCSSKENAQKAIHHVTKVDQGASQKLNGTWSSVEYKFFDLTYKENGIITTGSTIKDNLEKMYYKFDTSVDLSAVDAFEFYIKNTTGLPLAFGDISAQGVIATDNNEGMIDGDIEFWNQHAGCLWSLPHDYNSAPVLVKGVGDASWKKADTKAYGGTGTSVLTLPAGFEGYVRLEMTASEQYWNGESRRSDGIMLMLGSGYKDTEKGTPKCSDYADKSFVIKDLKAIYNDIGIDGYWRNAEADNYGLTYQTDGTITLGNNVAANTTQKMLYTMVEGTDLYYSEYIQFDIKNNTGLPLCFSDAGLLPMLEHNFSTNPFQVKAKGNASWVKADTTTYGAKKSVLTIPAGFEGSVRLPLSKSERSNTSTGAHRISYGVALVLSCGKEGSAYPASAYCGKTFVINNLIAPVNCQTDLYPKPAAPKGLVGHRCTSKNNTNGYITGASDKMEYRLKGKGTWTSVASGSTVISGLDKGEYEVRYKKAQPYPAGYSTIVKIKKYVSPYAKEYVDVLNDFEDMEAFEHIAGVEYKFLSGETWAPYLNEANNSVGAAQLWFAESDLYQKTFFDVKLGDLTDATHIQLYMQYTGETDFEITPVFAAAVDNNIMAGNEMCPVMLLQDEHGEWKEAEMSEKANHFVLPAGYDGLIRFELPEELMIPIENGFGFVAYDLSKGAMDGMILLDDLAVVTLTDKPTDTAILYEEYLKLRGNGFDISKFANTSSPNEILEFGTGNRKQEVVEEESNAFMKKMILLGSVTLVTLGVVIGSLLFIKKRRKKSDV